MLSALYIHTFYYKSQMSRVSIKIPSTIKLQIQINEQVKFGKIAYRPQDNISKVFHDLKRIKILPERIQQSEVKYFDKNNQQLSKTNEFGTSFDLSVDVNQLIKLVIPEKSIDIDQTTRRADEYIKTNKEKKSKQKQLNEAEAFVRNLKPIFSAIRYENYRQLSSLCENPEYLREIEDFAEEHRHLVNLVRVYEAIIERVLQSKDVSLRDLSSAQKIKDSAKEKIDSWVRKLNNLKKDERFTAQHWQMKEQAYQKQIKYLNEKLNKETQIQSEIIREKQREIEQNKKSFDEFQKDVDNRIMEYQKSIRDLQLQNTNLENKYEKYVQKIQAEKQLRNNQQNMYNKDFIKYVVCRDLILNQLTLKSSKICSNLLEKMKQCVPQMKNFKVLYKGGSSKGSQNFHKVTYLKENIFLIAKTKKGRIFGGFSSLPFDPNHRKHSPSNILNNIQAFIFSFYKEKLVFFPIKKGFDSVEYQQQYIVFGNEQICIEKYTSKVTSLFPNHQQRYLHYSDPHKLRKYFLSDNQETQDQLLGYELYQIEVEQ